MSIGHVIIACLAGVMYTLSWIYEWQWLGTDSRFTMGLVIMFVAGLISHKHGRWVERTGKMAKLRHLRHLRAGTVRQRGYTEYVEGMVCRGGINRKPPGKRPLITIVGSADEL